MSCCDGFTSTGKVALYSAHISHGLSFTRPTLRNADGWALDAQGMHVSDCLFLGSSIGAPDGNGGSRAFSLAANVDVYFARPHSPWEWGDAESRRCGA